MWSPYAARVAVLGVLMACAGVLVTQAPAHACKCAASTTADDVAAADAVFSGTVRETRQGRADRKDGRKRLVTHVVDVDRIYKAEGAVVTATVMVTSPRASAACGLGTLPAGTDFYFFAKARDAGFRATSCGGSSLATDRVRADVETVLGPGQQVVPDGEKPELVLTAVESSSPRTVSRVAAPGAALALIGVLGLVLLRLTRSRR
jgi:hypothetical protein